MWKWLVIVLAVISLGLFPVTALAATQQEVTITATPGYGILTFTVTYISETQLNLEWTADDSVASVMVRAQYGEDLDEIPDEDTEPSDGYLVYEGSDTSCSDTSMDFDQNPGPLYYKIWGKTEAGKWLVDSSGDWEESAIMTLLLFGLLTVGMSFFGWHSRHLIACIAAAGLWIFLWWYINGNVTAVTGAGLQLVTVICFAFAITMLLLGTFRAIRTRSTTDVSESYNEARDGGIKGIIHRLNADDTPIRPQDSSDERARQYREEVRRATRRDRPRRRV